MMVSSITLDSPFNQQQRNHMPNHCHETVRAVSVRTKWVFAVESATMVSPFSSLAYGKLAESIDYPALSGVFGPGVDMDSQARYRFADGTHGNGAGNE